MSHGYSVVDGYGIEFGCIAPHVFYLLLYYLSYLVKMGMTWHKLCKGVDHGYDRFAKLLTFHTCGHP